MKISSSCSPERLLHLQAEVLFGGEENPRVMLGLWAPGSVKGVTFNGDKTFRIIDVTSG